MQNFGRSQLIAAVHTPFDVHGEVNLAAIEQQAELLVRDGISTVFVAGTTGECTSLTLAERLELVERWCEVAQQTGQKVIVHVGSNCLKDSQQLARHAAERKVFALAAFSPSYFKPAEIADLVAWCAALATTTPDTPFYYYDIPSLTGVHFGLMEFLQQASARIPNLAGVKYSHDELLQLREACHHWAGKYEFLFGVDEMLLSALVFGIHAAVGSTYNLIPATYHQLVQAYTDHAMTRARELQQSSVQLVQLLQRYSFMPAAKAMMRFRGVDVGQPRMPNKSLTEQQLSSLKDELLTHGYL